MFAVGLSIPKVHVILFLWNSRGSDQLCNRTRGVLETQVLSAYSEFDGRGDVYIHYWGSRPACF